MGLGDYDATILVWIAFLCRLKTTGMPLRGMLTYAVLSKAGSGTTTARHVLLVRHRVAVRAQLAELSLSLGVFDAKIAS